ncbi:hypothetical protein [Dickeya dadantii]|uniref:hypothetical protein n=1 Tax=Dickeya dadantii TaxID=204038 RepID=UPI0012695112|nr:hypothetical protein [Dickeya dadantii]
MKVMYSMKVMTQRVMVAGSPAPPDEHYPTPKATKYTNTKIRTILWRQNHQKSASQRQPDTPNRRVKPQLKLNKNK